MDVCFSIATCDCFVLCVHPIVFYVCYVFDKHTHTILLLYVNVLSNVYYYMCCYMYCMYILLMNTRRSLRLHKRKRHNKNVCEAVASHLPLVRRKIQ